MSINYTKNSNGLFARIIGNISALTILLYIKRSNKKPIERNKLSTNLIPSTVSTILYE